jgi:hypothetical protein
MLNTTTCNFKVSSPIMAEDERRAYLNDTETNYDIEISLPEHLILQIQYNGMHIYYALVKGHIYNLIKTMVLSNSLK